MPVGEVFVYTAAAGTIATGLTAAVRVVYREMFAPRRGPSLGRHREDTIGWYRVHSGYWPTLERRAGDDDRRN